MQQCREGHFYDTAAHASCPFCPIAGLDVEKTVPVSPAARDYGLRDDARTQPARLADDGVTRGYHEKAHGMEPVVGWLVCVEGPARGRDYRVRSQRNRIGRDQSMDICVSGDDRISRENHAVIVYDPRNNVFKLAPGDARSIAYLNGESVDIPAVLKAYDLIELGDTHLRFVPFCGDQFKWQ